MAVDDPSIGKVKTRNCPHRSRCSQQRRNGKLGDQQWETVKADLLA